MEVEFYLEGNVKLNYSIDNIRYSKNIKKYVFFILKSKFFVFSIPFHSKLRWIVSKELQFQQESKNVVCS